MQNTLSPEKYIRTKARQLPIDKCYINEGWDECGECTIIVCRKHSNNNLTFGIYLVDIFCLGLKDSLYHFNISAVEFDDLMNTLSEQGDFLEIEYPLAHNIIYGAIEFASDYEFNPHKSFQLTQHILEEDTDDIELIEIPFGIDDQPAVVTTDDDPQTHIIKKLTKTAGEGNFLILNADLSVIDEDCEIDEYSEELLGDYSDYSIDELINGLQTHKDNLTKTLGLICELYIRMEGEEKFDELSLKIFALFKNLEITGDYEKEGLEFVPKEQTEHLYYLQALVFNHAENAIEECEKTVKKSPHPIYYSLLTSAYEFNDMHDKKNEVIIKAFDLFPESLSARIHYGYYLFNNNKVDKVEMFMSRFNPIKIAPRQKVFHINEITGIVNLACLFYTQTNYLLMATVYEQLFDSFTDLPEFVYEQKLNAFQLLCKKQMDYLIQIKQN
jgi:hypothetical protein